MRLRKGSLKMY